MRLRSFSLLMLVPVTAGTACQDRAELTGPGSVPAVHDVTVLFNPQPEPPKVYLFRGSGQLGGEWKGDYRDGAVAGSFEAVTTSFTQRGETITLTQTWTFYPPDPIKPVSLPMAGSLDLASGKLILRGITEGGQNVKAHADVVVSTSGALSVGGEFMFNPQPEPPRSRRAD